MADNDTESAPAPPPGFEDVPAGTETWSGAADGAEEVATQLAVTSVNAPDDVDEPDRNGQLHDVDAGAIQKFIPEGNDIYASASKFEDLGLSAELLQGLYSEMKFERPSKVQADTLPMILTPPYRCLIAQAKNGSGKTTCFVLGMLSRVDPSIKQPQALCICPTRELVMQNVAVLTKMARYTGITCTDTASIGMGKVPPITSQVVIGTIGKLKNWLAMRSIFAIKYMRIVVFDEADDMLAMDGFLQDSVKILKEINKGRKEPLQILFFSATFEDKMRAIAEKIAGPEANRIFIKKEDLSLDVIKQYRVECPTEVDKERVLKECVFPAAEKLGQCIIFVRTRKSARRLHSSMEAAGYRCTSIEGEMAHEDRDRVVQEFREGKTKILISTDVLARGFDHSNVTLVINYDPPTGRDGVKPAFETYMHRIGRSGRFGRKGAAFNLIYGAREKALVDAIAQHFNHPIPSVPHNDEEGFEEVLKEAGLA